MSNKYTEKRKESNLRYRSKLSKSEVWFTPEEKTMIKEMAKKEGKSLNSFIRNCLGLKDTPMSPMEMLSDVVSDYKTFRQKLIKYCSDKGYTYLRDDISVYVDPKNSANNVLSGGVIVRDKDGNETPIPLSTVELLKIQRIEITGEQEEK